MRQRKILRPRVAHNRRVLVVNSFGADNW